MTSSATNGTTATAPSFTEAPASINVRVVSPAGFDYQLTMRAARVGDVLNQAQELEKWLLSHDWKPAATRPQAAQGHTANGVQADGAPTCPTHNKPMKPGRNGGWYCPEKIAPDDGTGKPVYCKQRK